jgi:hypothetical protein
MFEWATGKRAVAACQAFVGVWVDGVARQQQAQADAVSTFCAGQAESLRVLFGGEGYGSVCRVTAVLCR